MFSLIDRYISKSFLVFFFSGLTVFLTLFLVIDFMSNMSRFDVSMAVMARYYGAYLFEILYLMLPMASLVGVVFTLSSLNKSKELTALFSLGMSLWRILAPMFVFIIIFSFFSFYLGDQVLPQSKKKKNYIYYVEMKKTPGLYSTVKTNKIWYRSDNIIFNINLLNAEKKEAHGVTLYYFSPEWKLQQLIYSNHAELEDDGWKLKDGTVTLFINEFTTPLTKAFDSKTIAMTEELANLQTTSSASDFLSFRELGNYIDKNKEAGLDMTRFEVDYHNKLSFPFIILVMSMLGVPFVITHERSGGAAKNVGLILVMTFVFWTSYSSGMALGRHGYLPPILATWGPNILMLGLTLFLFRLKKN